MYVFCAVVYLSARLDTYTRYRSEASFFLFYSRACTACNRRKNTSLNIQRVALLRSYGTAKSGVGISAMGVLRPDLMMKNVVPVVMAGIIAVSAYTPVDLKGDLTWAHVDLRPRRLCAYLWNSYVSCPCHQVTER